jgi:ABC-type branched-subunit amino acid transport system ATPase component
VPGEVVAGLAEVGTTVLLVEQRIALALDLASHVYVLVDGTPRFAGTAAEFSLSFSDSGWLAPELRQ